MLHKHKMYKNSFHAYQMNVKVQIQNNIVIVYISVILVLQSNKYTPDTAHTFLYMNVLICCCCHHLIIYIQNIHRTIKWEI